MSGGSFNYLCHKDADELFGGSALTDLRDMADALTECGAKDAAAETEQVIRFVEHALRQLEPRVTALQGVWRAKEWWDSCDIGQEDFKVALGRYRVAVETKEAAK